MVKGVDVGPALPGAFKDLVVNGVRQNSFTHDYNRGWTGNNGASKNNAYRIGRITAPANPQGGAQINRFFFHYNPQSVSLSTQVDPNVRAAADMAAAKAFADVTATETITFDFLLNRIPDVALQQAWANDSAKSYGTLHDLYYLFGLINRNFDDPTIKDFDYPPTDTGILAPYPVTVIFGELFRFLGTVTGLTIQHAKFVASPLSTPTSAPLVPVLTTVSMSLKRTPGAFEDAAGGDPTGGAGDAGIQDKTQYANGMAPIGEVPNQAYSVQRRTTGVLTGPDSTNQTTTARDSGGSASGGNTDFGG